MEESISSGEKAASGWKRQPAHSVTLTRSALEQANVNTLTTELIDIDYCSA